jgi:hypothetical protein
LDTTQGIEASSVFHIGALFAAYFESAGEVVKRLPSEALSKLKSSDIDGGDKAERIDQLKYLVGTDEYYRNKEFEKDKLEFDKKIL